MPTEKPDPTHVEWLVKNRAANQKVSARLYRLLRDFPDQAREKKFGAEAQMLIAVSFSLWRSAFLSDKTGRFTDTNLCAELFLEEMLMNNAIAYSQDRKSKDWAFNYYAANARYRILEYSSSHPKLKIGSLLASNPKDRWERLQDAFEKLVDHFEKRLRREADVSN
ncbi:MAG TPA: hypothetical protein VGR14_23175 [Verrucomicrobiae bacterium]|jgi:hypothetical protein|nr:hypothetical protein [Verrucomicrobiae bacterium]